MNQIVLVLGLVKDAGLKISDKLRNELPILGFLVLNELLVNRSVNRFAYFLLEEFVGVVFGEVVPVLVEEVRE